jgi:ParB family chromosome partitioning protein
LLPRTKVEASPYQRDVSPTHAKRLTEAVKKLDRFVDPIVAVSPSPGVYWTPNGNHRRTALEKLKAEYIPAILVAEPEVAFQVLPLNTEKAHNLKEKSLEVIRHVPGPRRAAAVHHRRGVGVPVRVRALHHAGHALRAEQALRRRGLRADPPPRDKFLKMSLRKGLEERAERAELVRAADETLVQVVAKVKKRGINHPYVKNYLLARTTPLTPGPQDAARPSSRRSRSCAATWRTST